MGGGISFIFPLILLAGMMFFMTRSQKKQQNERQSLLDSMKVGDKIVTIGGLHGVVFEFKEEDKTVCIDCEGIILEFDRAAIKTVMATTVKEDVVQDTIEKTVPKEIVESNKTEE